MTELNRLVAVKLGGIPKDNFSVPRPENAQVFDTVRDRQYTLLKGVTTADEAFDAALERAAGRAQSSDRATGLGRVLILINLIVLAAIVFFILLRSYRKLRSQTTAN